MGIGIAKQAREPLPSKPPPLSMMVRLIASLGGYVDRPNRLDPPGVETVWKGLQRMRDLAWGGKLSDQEHSQ